MAMIVREAGAADEAAVAEVQRLATAQLRQVYRPTAAAMARRTTRTALRRQLVCALDGAVVGAVTIEEQDDRWHLMRLAVRPEAQRRGVARALLAYAADGARAAGKRALSLHTIRQTGNVEVFVRLGFTALREVAEDPDLFASVTGETLVDVYMERQLGAGDGAARGAV